jgi:3-hydroxybutyryl-CoA dehydrogenase
MKIVVIAQSSLKKELASKNIPAGWEWTWIDSVSDLDRHRDADMYFDLDFDLDAGRIEALSRLLPAPVIVNSVVHTLREIGRPFIRISGWPGFLERNIHELAVPDEKTGAEISTLYEAMGWQYRIIPDIPGMISARILAGIINEAYFTFQEQVSTKTEIDIAMKLGTNYPFGPFEWSTRIGLEKIDHLLTAIQQSESRYDIAEELKKEAIRIEEGNREN